MMIMRMNTTIMDTMTTMTIMTMEKTTATWQGVYWMRQQMAVAMLALYMNKTPLLRLQKGIPRNP